METKRNYESGHHQHNAEVFMDLWHHTVVGVDDGGIFETSDSTGGVIDFDDLVGAIESTDKDHVLNDKDAVAAAAMVFHLTPAMIYGEASDDGAETFAAYRERIVQMLAHVPDGIYVDKEHVPGDEIERKSFGRLGYTKFILRTPAPKRGDFVADLMINCDLDPGAKYIKHTPAQTEAGAALVSILSDGPAIIRRLLAHIDSLEPK